MTCQFCESSNALPHSGVSAGQVNMRCIGCCARLLATTRPRSPQAMAMLDVIERSIKRHATSFTTGDVRQLASQKQAKRRSAGPRSASELRGG